MNKKLFILFAMLVSLSGCGDRGWEVTEITSPAGPGSGEPFLSAVKDQFWMSWLEKTSSGGHALKVARWNGNEWSSPQNVIAEVPFFVNWADFPSVLPLSETRLITHWLQKLEGGPYAYHVMVSLSDNMGKTWSHPAKVHTDSSPNEHGFATLINEGDGAFSAVWLDGRNFKGDAHDPGNAMSLMYSKVLPNHFSNEMTVDPKVCDCCQTAAVRTKSGVFVAYRDRTDQEIRDISYTRLINGKWSEPKAVHEDGWEIAGCPVNGPAVDAEQDNVVVAWYTGAKDQGRVKVAFSMDGGATFGAPVQVDYGKPSGRVDVVFLEDGSAVVSWLENQEGKGADIRIRRVLRDGSMKEALTVADTTNARSSGFPRMVRAGIDLYVAWTYTAEPPRIRIFRISR